MGSDSESDGDRKGRGGATEAFGPAQEFHIIWVSDVRISHCIYAFSFACSLYIFINIYRSICTIKWEYYVVFKARSLSTSESLAIPFLHGLPRSAI